MLGRLRRTTRVDVGLALALAGITYLVWAIIAGLSRKMVQEMIRSGDASGRQLPELTRVVKVFFVDTGFVIDLVGLAWLAVSLLLVALASRQKISVSWSWVSAMCQSFAAAGGAMLVGWAAYAPHILPHTPSMEPLSPLERVSGFSLPVIVVAAVLMWVTFLIWLLVDRARLSRRGPTLTDGLRSNIYK